MSAQRKSILIVDDERVVRESLDQWFTDEDYEVTVAASGKDGLAALARQHFDLEGAAAHQLAERPAQLFLDHVDQLVPVGVGDHPALLLVDAGVALGPVVAVA